MEQHFHLIFMQAFFKQLQQQKLSRSVQILLQGKLVLQLIFTELDFDYQQEEQVNSYGQMSLQLDYFLHRLQPIMLQFVVNEDLNERHFVQLITQGVQVFLQIPWGVGVQVLQNRQEEVEQDLQSHQEEEESNLPCHLVEWACHLARLRIHF